MSLDLGAIRTGLESTLGNVTGLRVYRTVPDKPEHPAAIISTDDPFVVPSTLRNGMFEVRLTVSLQTAGDVRPAQDKLDDLVEAVLDALYANDDWTSSVDSHRVESVGGYTAPTTEDGRRYLASDLSLVAYVTGS